MACYIPKVTLRQQSLTTSFKCFGCGCLTKSVPPGLSPAGMGRWTSVCIAAGTSLCSGGYLVHSPKNLLETGGPGTRLALRLRFAFKHLNRNLPTAATAAATQNAAIATSGCIVDTVAYLQLGNKRGCFWGQYLCSDQRERLALALA